VYKTGSKFLVTLYGFRGWPIKKWHSNLPRTLPGCHGNEIWDNMGHNSASAGDICEIFASIGGFSGLGHQILPTKFYPNRFLLPWQRNLKQKGYNSDFVRDISKIFASSGRFWGTGYWMRPILFHHNRPLLPFECHVTPNVQDPDCEMSMARYLRNWSAVAKRYFTNKTANINVQNIRLYTC